MITFDEASHTYRNGRGQLLPSVTFMLRCVGAAKPIPPYRSVQNALERGRKVHKAIELFIRGDLDLSTVDAVAMPYFEVFLDWYGKHCPAQFTRLKPEVILEGPGGLYAGKADLVAKDRYASDAVIDWKTGEEDPVHLVQDVLYCLAQSAKGKRPAAPFIVYLWPKKGWKTVTPTDSARTMREALSVIDVFGIGRSRHMAWLAKQNGWEEEID
jgi:hypothetical protein